MEICIVGSGICGLTAAIGLRKAGHKVRVFERSPTATAFGAGVVLGHNVSLVLDEYGLDWTAAHATLSKSIKVVNGTTLDKISTTSMDQANYEPRQGVKQYFLHRVDLQEALVDLATKKDGGGQPVEITYNAMVKSYDATAGSITLADGTTHTAELIVAADGVHSRAPAQLLGHEFDPKHTGTSIVRFMLPTDSIQADPTTANMVNDPGESTFYVSADRSKYLLRYPVRAGTLQNFGLYKINRDSAEIDDQIHRFTCDQESLTKELHGFHPSVLALVPKTTEILPVWKLVERTPMPTWHQGRLLTIGDAAHPMLPNQGQGAGMSVEDSAALGVIFGNMPANPSLEQISTRLAVFEKARKPRASVVQLLSSAPYFENGMVVMLPKLLEQMPREELPGLAGPQDTRPWLFNYDIVSVAKKALQEQVRRER